MINQETLEIFNKLYDATYSDVLKYVICNASYIDNVWDIVQNVYLEVLKMLKKGKINISEVYIMGIAKNKVKDYYRFSYKAKLVSLFSSCNDDIELIDSVPADIDIERDNLKKEEIDLIWKFLRKKKSIIPKIFYLYYYFDYSIKEVADTLHISEANVKNNLYRTLKELNILMKQRGDDNEK